jgi:hypothetical protein
MPPSVKPSLRFFLAGTNATQLHVIARHIRQLM